MKDASNSDIRIEPGNETTFKTKVAFDCPFCKRHAGIGEDANGVGGVIHDVPYCKEFDKMDALEYAQAVRLRLYN